MRNETCHAQCACANSGIAISRLPATSKLKAVLLMDANNEQRTRLLLLLRYALRTAYCDSDAE